VENQMRKIYRWLVCALLAAMFFLAAIHKFAEPVAFAELIGKNFQLPPFVVGGLAIWLPCLEVVLGAALLLPKAQRAALVFAACLLAVFAAIITLNLLRGLQVPCGCFSNNNEPATWWNVARNLFLILLAWHALLCNSNSKN
jgi:hypothetical protein